MKKLLLLVILAAVLLPLTGCACEHEWTPVDCVHSSVCAKCEEPGEAALGHDWAAATCSAPETCIRCGETQGEALPHTLGDWVIGTENMTRTCSGCGLEESAEIDRELALKQLLPGHWDFYESYLMEQTFTPEDLRYNSIGEAITVWEDGTARYFGGRSYVDATLAYAGFQQTEDGGRYALTMTTQFGETFDMALVTSQDAPTLYFYYTESHYTRMRKNDEVAAVLIGSWAANAEGQVYTLNLAGDRTFTGNLGSDISGSWHLQPMTVSADGFRSACLQLHWEENNYPMNATINVQLGNPESYTMEEYLSHTGFTLNLYSLGLLRFTRADDALMARTEAAMKLADQILPGTWTSEKLAYYPEGSTDRLEKETTEYSLTFGQDGTFTARFDREYTGTWTFQKVDFAKDYVAYYDYPGYRYKLTLEGADISSSIQILSHGRLYMEASDGKRSMSCWFNQTADGGADHAALAPSLIVGEWDAFELIEIGNGKSVQTPEPGAYTLTVREDSTFTLKAGGEVSGQWHFSEYTFQSGYGYGFLAEGAEGGMYYTIHTPGQLRAFYEIDGVSYGFMMQKK